MIPNCSVTRVQPSFANSCLRQVKPTRSATRKFGQPGERRSPRWVGVSVAVLLGGLGPLVGPGAAVAEKFPVYCQQTAAAIAQKEQLRKAAIAGNKDAQKKYDAVLKQHGDRLRKCRQQAWPQEQAIWIRLYPCDAKPGVLEAVLDRIVDRGYNQVYLESFYSGKVLLPANKNPTPWPSVLAGSGNDNVDLLARVIQKGQQRGLKVHSWVFGLNFGANYVRRPDRQSTLARNGLGQTSLNANIQGGLSVDFGQYNPDEVFVDPYSPQARQDYAVMLGAIAQRKPSSVLMDYIRYPRGYGAASVASKVQDLWVYGEASQQALLNRAQNSYGASLLQRYLSQGRLKLEDFQALQPLPGDRNPLWQGIAPVMNAKQMTSGQQVGQIQDELWRLSVAHAAQGVVDFVNDAIAVNRQHGLRTGVVFFPEGNQRVGQGFDSRLQLWDRFSSSPEWHPMAYGVCGNTGCIMQQIKRVLDNAPPGVQVKPVLAGIWQRPTSNRPSLEDQMQVLRYMAPQLNSVSHFAFSWQEPGSDRDRKACAIR